MVGDLKNPLGLSLRWGKLDFWRNCDCPPMGKTTTLWGFILKCFFGLDLLRFSLIPFSQSKSITFRSQNQLSIICRPILSLDPSKNFDRSGLLRSTNEFLNMFYFSLADCPKRIVLMTIDAVKYQALTEGLALPILLRSHLWNLWKSFTFILSTL